MVERKLKRYARRNNPIIKKMESKAKSSLCSKSKKKTKLHEYEETKGLMCITIINHTQEHDHTKFSK